MNVTKGPAFYHYMKRLQNIMDFHVYYSVEYRSNGYFIKTLKPLNVSAIHIPRVGWIQVHK